MGYKIVWTESGVSDAEAIAEYIARDSRLYAAQFTLNARVLAKTLRSFAERGRSVPEIKRSDVRELLWGNYRMIYQITADTIYVVRFFHGAKVLNIADIKSKLE